MGNELCINSVQRRASTRSPQQAGNRNSRGFSRYLVGNKVMRITIVMDAIYNMDNWNYSADLTQSGFSHAG